MRLDERTQISLFSVLTALPIIVGFTVWLSSVSSNTNANASEISSLKQSSFEQSKILNKIQADVAFIRGKLEKR